MADNFMQRVHNPANKCELHNITGRACGEKIPEQELVRMSHLKNGEQATVNGRPVTGNASLRGMARFAIVGRHANHRGGSRR